MGILDNLFPKKATGGGQSGLLGMLGYDSPFADHRGMLMGLGAGLLSGNNASAPLYAMQGMQFDQSNAEARRKKQDLASYANSITDPKARALFMQSPEAFIKSQIESQPLSPEQEAQKIKIAQAGRSQVNVNPGENEYQKELGKANAKGLMDVRGLADKAREQLVTFDQLDKAMQDPNFDSGLTGNAQLYLKRGQVLLGGNPKAAASMEEFNRLSKKAALESMGGSLGAGFSNADRDFVEAQVPNLSNTPEGNKRIVDIGRRLAKRQQEIGNLAEQFSSQSGGMFDAGAFNQYLQNWSEKNPLFTDDEKKQFAPAKPQNSQPAQSGAINNIPFRVKGRQ
jgi:hypothetical protein